MKPKKKFFISYAHADKDYFDIIKKELLIHTKRNKNFEWEFWFDGEILMGENWEQEIDTALNDCDCSILLLSPAFTASDYCTEIELKRFLERNEQSQCVILPVVLRDFNLSHLEDISEKQFFKAPAKNYNRPHIDTELLPFSYLVDFNIQNGTVLPNSYRDTYIKNLVIAIEKSVKNHSFSSSDKKINDPVSEARVKVKPPHLFAQPHYIGSHKFVGRQAELNQLDDWVNEADPHPVFLFEAIGGSGKSILTWNWLKERAQQIRPDLKGVFWYSFYERGATMTDFCRYALAYMTQKPFEHFEKKRIGELSETLLGELRAAPWLLVLDGLERVLVAYHRIDAASVPDEEVNQATDKISGDRDPRAAIKPEDDDLLRAFASAPASKILISSRLVPKVLVNNSGQGINGVKNIPLLGLRPDDALAMIEECGVKGDKAAIKKYLSQHCGCHPLVIGVLAGLIREYLPAKYNFDLWAADTINGGGQLDLAALDLKQKRNHILEFAFKQLRKNSQKLLGSLSFLQDNIDYTTLAAFSPHKGKNEKQAYSALQNTIGELEKSGFLQYDGGHYNLHPVIRGVVSGRLGDNEKQDYGQEVVDYFSQKANTRYEKAETLADVQNGLQIMRTLLKMKKWQEAFDVYEGDFANALYHNLGAYNETLALLKPFFPNGWDELPTSIRKGDACYLMNAVAISNDNLIWKNKAIELKYRCLAYSLELKDWENLMVYLRNLSNSFEFKNQWKKVEQYRLWTVKISNLLKSKQAQFKYRLSYFNYLVRIGAYDDAAKEWKEIEPLKDMPYPRHLYRKGLAENGYCYYQFVIGELNEQNLKEGEAIARIGKSKFTVRYFQELWAIWYMEKGEWAQALSYLNTKIKLEHESGLSTTESETMMAIAQFQLGTLKHVEEKANELSNRKDVDDLYVAELWEAIGNVEKATKHALKAYKKYWGDGEPYVDRYWLDRTAALLNKMGVVLPDLPPFDPDTIERHPIEDKIEAAIEELRRKKGKG